MVFDDHIEATNEDLSEIDFVDTEEDDGCNPYYAMDDVNIESVDLNEKLVPVKRNYSYRNDPKRFAHSWYYYKYGNPLKYAHPKKTDR